MGGKNSFVHGVGQHFMFPPNKLVIVGLDTKDTFGSHPLWRADAKQGAPTDLIDSIRKHRVLQPGRCRKIDDETAEVVMGRDRVKACRVLEAEGMDIKMPMLVWPKGTSIAEIIGAANAENFVRKHETVIQQADHVYMQLQAEGYFDGKDADECIKSVSASTGMSAQRVRNLVAFREDSNLVGAVESKTLGGEQALAIATLEDPAARVSEIQNVIANPDTTIVETRERVSYKKHAEKKAKPTKASKGGRKPAKKDDDAKGPGVSKPLQKRIVESEMNLVPEERNLDPLVIKTLKVCAGLAEASTVPGFTKALKSLNL